MRSPPLGRRRHGKGRLHFAQLRSDRGLCVEVGGKKILLVRDGEAFAPIPAMCPHAGAPLEEGAVCDGRIVCPWHKAAFRVSDGALFEPPALDGLDALPGPRRGRRQSSSAPSAETRSAKRTVDARTSADLRHCRRRRGRRARRRRRCANSASPAASSLIGREPGLPFDRTSLSKFVVAGEMKPRGDAASATRTFYDEQRIERIEGEVAPFDVRDAAILARRTVADRLRPGAPRARRRARELDVPGRDPERRACAAQSRGRRRDSRRSAPRRPRRHPRRQFHRAGSRLRVCARRRSSVDGGRRPRMSRSRDSSASASAARSARCTKRNGVVFASRQSRATRRRRRARVGGRAGGRPAPRAPISSSPASAFAPRPTSSKASSASERRRRDGRRDAARRRRRLRRRRHRGLPARRRTARERDRALARRPASGARSRGEHARAATPSTTRRRSSGPTTTARTSSISAMPRRWDEEVVCGDLERPCVRRVSPASAVSSPPWSPAAAAPDRGTRRPPAHAAVAQRGAAACS